MPPWNECVALLLLGGGAFFSVTGGVGILRFPDFYSRLHPAGKCDTLGQFLLLTGLCFLVAWEQQGQWLVAGRLGLCTLLLLITAPTATYAMARAAWLDGLEPWTGPPKPSAPAPPATGPQASRGSADD